MSIWGFPLYTGKTSTYIYILFPFDPLTMNRMQSEQKPFGNIWIPDCTCTPAKTGIRHGLMQLPLPSPSILTLCILYPERIGIAVFVWFLCFYHVLYVSYVSHVLSPMLCLHVPMTLFWILHVCYLVYGVGVWFAWFDVQYVHRTGDMCMIRCSLWL